jgi:hypothetical protein
VSDIDIEQCPHCGGQPKLTAAIEEPAMIEIILSHLGLAAQPPLRAPARQVDLLHAARFAKPDWVGTALGEALDWCSCKRVEGAEIRLDSSGYCL